MLLNMIVCADEDVQQDFFAAYQQLLREHPMRNVPPFIRDVFAACDEAQELINEAKEDCSDQHPPLPKPKPTTKVNLTDALVRSIVDVGSKVQLGNTTQQGIVSAIIDRQYVLVRWNYGGEPRPVLRVNLQPVTK